jgi:hypothetical protein
VRRKTRGGVDVEEELAVVVVVVGEMRSVMMSRGGSLLVACQVVALVTRRVMPSVFHATCRA